MNGERRGETSAADSSLFILHPSSLILYGMGRALLSSILGPDSLAIAGLISYSGGEKIGQDTVSVGSFPTVNPRW